MIRRTDNQYDPIWLAKNTQTWKELDDLAGWRHFRYINGVTRLVGYHDLLDCVEYSPYLESFSRRARTSVLDRAYVPTYLDWYSSQLMGQ